MNNWCRILNNVVQEIGQFSINPNGTLFNPSLIWIQDTTGTAQLGWLYNPLTATFSAPSIPTPAPSQQWAAYQSLAQSALNKSDVTMTRIGEAVSLGLTTWIAVDVVAWVQYRRSLRAILTQLQPTTIPTTLPIRPAYPAGT